MCVLSLSVMDYLLPEGKRPYESLDTRIRRGRFTVDFGIREYTRAFEKVGDNVPVDLFENVVVQGVAQLAANNCFDSVYRVGSLFVRSKGLASKEDWLDGVRLSGAGFTGRLGHLALLRMCYDVVVPEEQKPEVVRAAIFDAPGDGDVLLACEGVVNTLGPEGFVRLEELLKK